jgi:hypothetical protein
MPGLRQPRSATGAPLSSLSPEGCDPVRVGKTCPLIPVVSLALNHRLSGVSANQANS